MKKFLLKLARKFKIKELIELLDPEEKDPKPEPAPNPQPEPQPEPPPDVEPTFFSEINWLRKDTWGPNAKVTKRLVLTGSRNGRLDFEPFQVSDWPAGSLGGDLKGVICIVVMRDGKWTGGKFEHIRDRMTHRDLKNVRNGYISGLNPRSGETVRYFLLNYPGTEASNWVESTYP